jgi:FMN phosphatase YigB (HAD superfamily)
MSAHRGLPPSLVFVDFDDTIVDTAPRFSGARRQLFDLLGRFGYSAEEAERLHHHEIDPEMRDRFGFGPHRLEHSFRETYHRLRLKAGHDVDESMADQCAQLGRAVAGPPPALDGAVDALRTLASRVRVVLYTQAGDAAYQLSCIRAAGILDFLPESRIRIAVSKGVDDFRDALRAFDVSDASDVWM